MALLAGFYPAVVLSGYKPILALKGKVLAGLDSARRYCRFSYRSVLVVLQFTIAQMLILLTLVVYNHMQFISDRPLGFNQESVVVAFVPGMSKTEENINRLNNFRERLKTYPEIEDVSYYSSNLQSVNCGRSNMESERITGVSQFVDHNFIKNYELQIIAGEPFKRDANSSHDIIVNQTLL